MELTGFIGQGIIFFTRTRARIKRSSFIFTFGLVLWLLSASYAANTKQIDPKTVQQLQSVNNAQLQICLPAIESLGRSKNAAVVIPLADAFAQETRPVVRRYIVDALGNLRNRASLPALKQALRDPEVQVRQSAVASIGLLGADDVQDALLEQAAREHDPAVKRQLVHQLGLLQTPEATKALRTFSQDGDLTVRDMANRRLDKERQEKR